MSLALARKYRPSTFDDLVGQDAVSQTLSLALEGDRLSHAYLFSGLRGSGKTSTARIFAKALLCEKGPTAKPCNTCEQCIMANESRHMDIIEMDAASNRGIDDIKELIEHTKYKPSTGRFKIFIIDEVHMLTTQAFNALLKTLEEPPDFVKFILATTDPLKLPATILSRTQHFRFKKIPQRLVTSHLQHILDTEKVTYDKEALEIIARSGAGSLRDSLTLLDQAIVYSKNHVDVATVTGMLGIIEPHKLDALLEAIRQKDRDRILAFIKEANTFETEMLIDELTLHLKEIFLSGDGRFSPMEIDRFFRILSDAKSLLSLGSDGEFVLSLALFKMVEALALHDIDTMIRTLQKELSGVHPSSPATAASARPIEKEIDISDVAPEAVAEEHAATQTLDAHTAPEATVSDKTTANETAPDATEANKVSSPSSSNATSTSASAAPQTSHHDDPERHAVMFRALIDKLYDRDYELGTHFENHITFQSYQDQTLTWVSTAQDEVKKNLIRHWNIIKMFVQDIFGVETRIVNIASEPKKKTSDPTRVSTVETPSTGSSQPPASDGFAQSASMIEDLELGHHPEPPVDTGPYPAEAFDETDPSAILQEPMIEAVIKHFAPKKVRIIRKS